MNHSPPALLFLPVSILMLALFSLGVGLFLSSLAIYFSDVAEMYQIILMAWFYLSPIIYTDELLPDRLLGLIKIFNPMYHLINLFRTPILSGQIPSSPEILVSCAWALGSVFIGWIVFARRADEFSLPLCISPPSLSGRVTRARERQSHRVRCAQKQLSCIEELQEAYSSDTRVSSRSSSSFTFLRYLGVS